MSEASLLFIGLNYAPEPVGIGPYSAGLCEALAASGQQVTAVVGKAYYPHWRVDPAYAGGGWKRSEEEGVQVIRCPHFVPAEPTSLARIGHLASFALASLPAAFTAVLRNRPQVVLCVAPALLSLVCAWLVARLCGAKLWIHVQDFEVETALATGLMQERRWPAKLGLWLESWVLRRGDRVSTISPKMLTKLGEKGVPEHRRFELRNWADARFVLNPAGAVARRALWGLGSNTVALYSGNIALKQGIEILIEAARLLSDRPDITFVICGEGPHRRALAAQAAGLANVQLHDLQPVSQMGAMLAMADLHLLPQIAGAADLVLPSKLTNMLASGRPVIATANPGTGLYAEIEGCGIPVPPGDAQALAAAIVALADDPDRRAVLGRVAADRAVEHWQQSAIIAKTRVELARLVAQG